MTESDRTFDFLFPILTISEPSQTTVARGTAGITDTREQKAIRHIVSTNRPAKHQRPVLQRPSAFPRSLFRPIFISPSICIVTSLFRGARNAEEQGAK